MKNLYGRLIRLCVDLDDGEVDARSGEETFVGVPEPAHGVRTPCLAGILDEPLHAGVRSGGIPPDDSDVQGFRDFEREL